MVWKAYRDVPNKLEMRVGEGERIGGGQDYKYKHWEEWGSRARRNVTNRSQGCLHRVLDYKGWAGKSNKSTTSYTSSVARRGKSWHV